MEHFLNVEFFRNKCSVLVANFYIVYSLCGAMYYEKYIRFRFKLFLIFYLFASYLFCMIPQLKILVTDSKLEYIYVALRFIVYFLSMIPRIYAFYSKTKHFHRLFDLVNEYEDKPAPVFDLQHDLDDLKKTNILNVCIKIYLIHIVIIVLAPLVRFSGTLLDLHRNTTIAVNTEWEFPVPFVCENCNTLASYVSVLLIT